MSALYNRFCNTAQAQLNYYIPDVPRGTVRAMCKNFALNFSLTLLESRGDLYSSTKNGGVGVLVTIIQTVASIALKHLQPSLSENHYTPWGTLVFSIFVTRAIGIPIDIKGSLFGSCIIYLTKRPWE